MSTLEEHITRIGEARNAVACVRRDFRCTHAEEHLVSAAEDILICLLAVLQGKMGTVEALKLEPRQRMTKSTNALRALAEEVTGRDQREPGPHKPTCDRAE